jgi:hypothetical protein
MKAGFGLLAQDIGFIDAPSPMARTPDTLKRIELGDKEYEKQLEAASKKLDEAKDKLRLAGMTDAARLNEAIEKANTLLVAAESASGIDAITKTTRLAEAYGDQAEALSKLVDLKEKLRVSEESRRDSTPTFQRSTAALSSGESLRVMTDQQTQIYVELAKNAKMYNDDDAKGIQRRIELNERLTKVNAKLQTAWDKQQQLANEVGDVFASNFSRAIFEGAKLKEVLGGLAQDLARMIIQRTILMPIANMVAGTFMGMFGGAAPAAGAAGAAAPAFSGTIAMPSIGLRAEGGPVTGNSPYIVGERGPELVIPKQSGLVIPNDVTRSLMSGGGEVTQIHQVFNIASGVTRSELIPVLKSYGNSIKADIQDAMSRGGARRAAYS